MHVLTTRNVHFHFIYHPRLSAFLIFVLIFNILPYPVPVGYCNSRITEPPKFTYSVVEEYPHDSKAFTQGLAWDQGNVYEGTGLYGQSSLRRVDLQTGSVDLKREYDQQIFAEGITIYRDKIYQLTWKNKRIFEYAKHDFSLIRSWPFSRQGWGITHDNKYLIVSDGTANLYFLDPKTMVEKRLITVFDDQGPVSRLNELEYIDGKIYANVWKTDQIAVIDPEDGMVTCYIDLSGLSAHVRGEKRTDVLNGIMYDPVGDRLFVTGKLWPSIFEIRIVPVD